MGVSEHNFMPLLGRAPDRDDGQKYDISMKKQCMANKALGNSLFIPATAGIQTILKTSLFNIDMQLLDVEMLLCGRDLFVHNRCSIYLY